MLVQFVLLIKKKITKLLKITIKEQVQPNLVKLCKQNLTKQRKKDEKEAKKEKRRNQEHMLLSPSLSVWHSEKRTSIAKKENRLDAAKIDIKVFGNKQVNKL